jgi:hypothetical protein
MKRCPRCGETKEPTSFNRSSKSLDGLQNYCRSCQAAHYRRNQVRHKANAKHTRARRKGEARALLIAALAGGCVDCGVNDLRVLQFDHVRGEKVEAISELVRRGAALSMIVAEIEKCEVRCANCHAIATFARLGGSWRSRTAPTTAGG